MNVNSPITDLKGIGEKTKDSFVKIGVYTVGDILLHFPRNYIKYPEIVDINDMTEFDESQKYAIHALIKNSCQVRNTKRFQLTLLQIGDSGHIIELVWYRMPYLKSQLIPGRHMVFYGNVKIKNGHYVMEQPDRYSVEEYSLLAGSLWPVYPLTEGISNNLITKTVRQTLNFSDMMKDYLSPRIKTENQLCEYNYALKQIHFPDSFDALVDARRRLVFDEFFNFIMGIRYHNEKKEKEVSEFRISGRDFVYSLIDKLPYTLTNAQKKCIDEILGDISSNFVMQRLIQGDVGSGKTIVAFLIMALTARCGYQSAIMAPTEVLAKQHYKSFCQLCQDFNLDFPVILLTGSMTAKEKRLVYNRMEEEKNALIIGTHTLIQEKANFDNLALVITDEQHRFGVKQRDAFAGKGNSPHILVMSATPIPRTLAIIIYGDMDISVINEVPAQRLPIKNCVVGTGYRPKAYSFIEDQVKAGHQVYIICPLVEATDKMEGENVLDYARQLKDYLPSDISIGVLHGKMKNALKDLIMEDFAANKINVLVSTTVVEVGVNVPNATVMMVENADRFGLAQLHQLRGRVGRGSAQSYCIFVNTSNGKTAKKRLETLNQSNDGFYIASQDLKLRGPGDFFGIRQSGDLAFKLGDIYQDADLLGLASDVVTDILEQDPDLEMEEHQIIKFNMQEFMDNQIKKMNL